MAVAKPPTCFISYSWDDSEHSLWVRDLASRLRDGGVDVTLDQDHQGGSIPMFMESGIRDSDFVVFVCTPGFARKANDREGGLSYEVEIAASELVRHPKEAVERFIPILREGTEDDAIPTFLAGTLWLDMRGRDRSGEQFALLLDRLTGAVGRAGAPTRPRSGRARHNVTPLRRVVAAAAILAVFAWLLTANPALASVFLLSAAFVAVGWWLRSR